MTPPPTGEDEAHQPQSSRVKPASARGTAKPGDSVPLPTGPFPTLPTDFGRYQVQKLLGLGQMGAVYLAHDRELERDVALKVARISATGSPRLLERLKIEAKAAARIDDPRVRRVHEVGEIDGIHFIAQQYVSGEDLRSRLKRLGRKQPPAAAVALILELAKGLQAAHAQGVLHRDLKPENVMIRPDGTPVIMDFGLARVASMNSDARKTQAGMILGTVAYMSVEQARGALDEIDERSDLYALGVMLFELLTGELPFTGSAVEILGQKCVTDAPSILSLDPDLPPVLADICSGLLERRKEGRCPSCEELIKRLEFARLELDRPADPSIMKVAPLTGVIVTSKKLSTQPRPRPSTYTGIMVLGTSLLLLVGAIYGFSRNENGSSVPASLQSAAQASAIAADSPQPEIPQEIPKATKIDLAHLVPLHARYKISEWSQATAVVVDVDEQNGTLHVINSFGPWEFKLASVNENITLKSVKGIGSRTDASGKPRPPNLFTNIRVDCSVTNTNDDRKLVLEGFWDLILFETGETTKDLPVKLTFVPELVQ